MRSNDSYGNAEIPQWSPPLHAGRKKAIAPFPLGSRRRWSHDSDSGYVLDGRPLDAASAATDDSGYDLPADDEADPDSDYGPL